MSDELLKRSMKSEPDSMLLMSRPARLWPCRWRPDPGDDSFGKRPEERGEIIRKIKYFWEQSTKIRLTVSKEEEVLLNSAAIGMPWRCLAWAWLCKGT